jgi:hypothetical protein
MIPKGGNRFSEKDHAQTKSLTTIRFNLIGSWSRAAGAEAERWPPIVKAAGIKPK